MDDTELKEALAEALRRDPTLGGDTSPAGLTALRIRVDEVAQELRIKRQLEELGSLRQVAETIAKPLDISGDEDAGSLTWNQPESLNTSKPRRTGLIGALVGLVVALLAIGALGLVVKSNTTNRARAEASSSAGMVFQAFATEASHLNAAVMSSSASEASVAAAQAASSASVMASIEAEASARRSRQAEINAAHSAELQPQLDRLDHAYNCSAYGGFDPKNPNWAC